jgi:hypothetical protein
MLICKIILLALIIIPIIPAAAQDAAIVNLKIVNVEFENNKVACSLQATSPFGDALPSSEGRGRNYRW